MDRRVKPGGDENEMTKTNNLPRSYEEHLAGEEFRARFEAEKLRVQRHYCTLFKFWRTCQSKPCRRLHVCTGDPGACLARCVGELPRRAVFDARQALVAAMPPNCPAPEREARLIMANEPDWRCPPPPAGWQRVSQRKRGRGRR
jgi:hypothetical protein